MSGLDEQVRDFILCPNCHIPTYWVVLDSGKRLSRVYLNPDRYLVLSNSWPKVIHSNPSLRREHFRDIKILSCNGCGHLIREGDENLNIMINLAMQFFERYYE